MKIAIFGASGFLGTKLLNTFSKKYEVIGADKEESERIEKVNALDINEVESFLQKHQPDLVINTIALTSSVQCERNPLLAKELNYSATKNIVEACKKIEAIFIFISSSYLFDGKIGKYNEEDTPNPKNVYGKTKLIAEKEILNYEKSIILRTTIMYGYNRNSKGNGVLNPLLENKTIELRDPNQLRQPIWIEDVPKIIISLVEKKEKGIFHMAGPDRVKMLDFIQNLKKASGSKSKIKVIIGGKKILDIPKRDTFDCSKLEELKIKTTPLKEGLKLLKKQIKKN